MTFSIAFHADRIFGPLDATHPRTLIGRLNDISRENGSGGLRAVQIELPARCVPDYLPYDLSTSSYSISIWSVSHHRFSLIPVSPCASYSNAKMRFQSFFMLMTTQPFFFASAISASEKVPIFDLGP